MCSSPCDVLAALDAALGALAAEDLDGRSDAELLDRSGRLVAARNRLGAALASTVRRAENQQAAEHDGLKTMRSWLTTHTRLSGPAVAGIVRQGRAIEVLPGVEPAYLAGRITADSVETIAEIARRENVDKATAQEIDLTVIADVLVTIAATQPHRALQAAVGRYLAQLDPDGTEPDPTEDRSLVLAQHPDGTVTGGLTFDQAGGETVMTALEVHAAAGRCAGDTRTRAQRMADALVQICANALAAGSVPQLRTVPAQLLIMIDEADLVDPAVGPGAGRTGTGALISAARARRIACDSQVSRIVLGPASVPVDLGRTQRLVSPAQRRALTVRDRGCVFAGCEAPDWWCEAHHVLEWVFDGPTDLDNLGLLCERHHTKVHSGFRVERRPDGRWRTYRPDGTEIVTAPASPAQVAPEDDLAVRVTLCGRDEFEPRVEAGRAASTGHVAGAQLRGAPVADQFHDLLPHLPAVARALVDEQLPEEPRAVYVGRLGLHVPAQHREPDR